VSSAQVEHRSLEALRAAVATVDARADDGTVAVTGQLIDLVGGGSRAVHELATLLYLAWFSGSPAAAEPFTPGGSRDLAETLRAAHAGTFRFGRGWRVRRVSSTGRVAAERDGELQLLGSADYVAVARPGLAPRVGHEIAASARRDSLAASPGYWLTMHPRWPERELQPPLVRIYWSARDLPALVRALTATLLDSSEPWALKVPVDSALHARRDGAVLYLARADYAALAPAVRGAADAVRGVLVPEEPPLTLRLAPGVGLAEDPGGDHSFGTSRCLLVAEGIAVAVRSGEYGGEAMIGAVLARMRDAGVDPELAHLEPGSERTYAWPERVARVSVASPSRWTPRRRAGPAEPASALRDAALEIARQLTESAIWHEDRCTWLGESIEPAGAGWTTVTRTCDGGLYGGTAGVGRFLALAGERETALGAFRHALSAAQRGPLHHGGLFLGPLGTAWAALDAAASLDDAALRDAATDLALRAAAAVAAGPAREHDLLSGDAGAVLGLVAVDRALGGDRHSGDLLAAASSAAERLLVSAQRDARGAHWPSPAAVSPYGLCGLAHGASGVALALSSLQRRSGDPRHAEAAAAALAYERSWFRGEAGCWPDLREATAADLAAASNLSYPSFWCHGAVGIGLVRLVAYAWDRRTADLAEAGAAIHAARTASAATLGRLATDPGEPGPVANWSLCHGLLGTAELMLCAAQILAEPAHLAAARRLGEHAVADRAALGAWRCGVTDAGETPGVMLGLAGIGTTLLRLDDPSCASSPALPGV
jgi:hypothetical protein